MSVWQTAHTAAAERVCGRCGRGIAAGEDYATVTAAQLLRCAACMWAQFQQRPHVTGRVPAGVPGPLAALVAKYRARTGRDGKAMAAGEDAA